MDFYNLEVCHTAPAYADSPSAVAAAGMIPVNPAQAFHYVTGRKATAAILGEQKINGHLTAEVLGCLPITLMLTIACVNVTRSP